MTEEEARRVARVISGVDGGCHICVASACRGLEALLPEHNWFALVVEVDGDWWTEEELRSTV